MEGDLREEGSLTMTDRRGKQEKPIPDVTVMSNELLLETYASSVHYYDWTTTAAEDRYHEAIVTAARTEILKRMSK